MTGLLPISPEGGWPLALARGLAVATLLSAFGTLLFRAAVLPRLASPDPARRPLARLATASLAATGLFLLAWAALQTADMARTGGDARALAAALPSVLGGTLFGRVWLAQLAATAAAGAVAGRTPRLALIPCTLAVLLQAGHSHALSMYGGPSLLLLSDAVHLLAAGAWLGGLLPLLLAVRALPPGGGAQAARWFSPLGKASVVAMVLTAGVQGWQLIGTLPGLVGTPYGEMALVKLALFGLLVAFALANRYRLAPALVRAEPVVARRTLVRSIAVQTGIGLATVLAAALLSNLAPALHEEPTWPFPRQLSLVTVNEDPELRQAVALALLEMAGAALALAAALALRRFRVLAALGTAAVVFLAAPTLRLLLVPAYPTTFFHSPTDFAATAVVHGGALFARHCAACHGSGGRGDGPAAASLPIPPADLTQPHLWAHADGDMFWWLSHGIEAPDGSPAMPGFARTLSPDDRWTLIDYVRANNAGAARRDTGTWPVPVAAPDLVANCPGGHTAVLTSLRGRPVRLVFPGGSAAPAPLDDPALVTITVGHDPAGCAAADPAVPRAYALVLGTAPAALAGSAVFVDPNGWLRPEPSAEASPAELASFVRTICAHPLAAAAAAHTHEH